MYGSYIAKSQQKQIQRNKSCKKIKIPIGICVTEEFQRVKDNTSLIESEDPLRVSYCGIQWVLGKPIPNSKYLLKHTQ